jgi:hypothetical protein
MGFGAPPGGVEVNVVNDFDRIKEWREKRKRRL